MTPSATHITYLHLCHRKLWLFHHGIQMEHRSALVQEGKWIHEKGYAQRNAKHTELQVGGLKIDHYDHRRHVLHETKKSNKRESAHIAQLKYYLFTLEKYGIPVKYGVLEYPKLREREEVWLTDDDRSNIPLWIAEVQNIVSHTDCPTLEKKTLCKRCAYYEFCFV